MEQIHEHINIPVSQATIHKALKAASDRSSMQKLLKQCSVVSVYSLLNL